jgi:hypothetical protein
MPRKMFWHIIFQDKVDLFGCPFREYVRMISEFGTPRD